MGEISTVDFFPFAWIIHLARALVFYNIVTAMTKRKLSNFWHFMVIVAPSICSSAIICKNAQLLSKKNNGVILHLRGNLLCY